MPTDRDAMCPSCGSNVRGEPGHACSVKMPCGWCGEDPKTGRLVRWSGSDGPLRIPRLGWLKRGCNTACSAWCPRTDPGWCAADYILRMIERWWYGGVEPGAVSRALETEHGRYADLNMFGILDAIERYLGDRASIIKYTGMEVKEP